MGGGIPFRTALRERLGIINVSEEKVHRIMLVCLVVWCPKYMIVLLKNDLCQKFEIRPHICYLTFPACSCFSSKMYNNVIT